MKINFDTPIRDAAGQPMKDAGTDNVATLASVASGALFASLPGDESMQPTQKAEIGALGIALFAAGERDLRAEQIAMLKDRIGRAYAPLVVARAFEVLDPADAST